MISIIPGYRNRNLLVKWINSHQHHTCVYMGTVLFPFSYIVEQSKAPHSVSQSSSSYVFLFSRVTHREYCEVCHPYSVSQYCTQMTCARVHLSTYGNIVTPQQTEQNRIRLCTLLVPQQICGVTMPKQQCL